MTLPQAPLITAPWQGHLTIAAREELTPDYFTLAFDAPELADARPGQFLNVKVEAQALCLRRPISIHAVEGQRVTVMVGVFGVGTRWLQSLAVGDTLDVLGPLGGRGLTLDPGAKRVALVGGGVGVPPLHFVATRRPADGLELVAFIGARNRGRLLGIHAFRDLGCEVVPATDDGSEGYHGTVVDALAEHAADRPFDQVLTCGPTPMMRAAADWSLAADVPCQVCLEARMACALGACLSCVIETRTEGWQRYQRVCTEGPVFHAGDVVWDSLSPLVAL